MNKPNVISRLGSVLPESIRTRLKILIPYYSRRHCPVCGQYQHADFKLYKPDHPECPHCHSMPRHRFVWLYLTMQTDLLNPQIDQTLLYFAPEYGIYSQLKKFPKIKHTTTNILLMKLVRVSVLTDITLLGLKSNSYDLVFCSHVLEHIPADRAAMQEIFRVLKPGGSAIILVPIRDGNTFEDFSIVKPDERERFFGQDDHVRWYGMDIVDRLESTGFQVKKVYPKEFISRKRMKQYEIPEIEPPLFHCTK